MYLTANQSSFTRAVLCTALLAYVPGWSHEEQIQPAQSDQLHQALESMTRFPIKHGADRPLLELPAEEAIPGIVRAMREGDAFQAPRVRRRLYSVLGRRYARERSTFSPGIAELAYQQLLAGLAEPDYRIKQSCAMALGAVPPELRAEATLAVGAAFRRVLVLLDGDMQDEEREWANAFVAAAIGALGSSGESAHPYLRACSKRV